MEGSHGGSWPLCPMCRVVYSPGYKTRQKGCADTMHRKRRVQSWPCGHGSGRRSLSSPVCQGLLAGDRAVGRTTSLSCGARGENGISGGSQSSFQPQFTLGRGKTRVKRQDRAGVCSSANRLLLFTAQLHPTRASKAQSQAAGKLEERSEGEGPHQLSQQRKDCLFFHGLAGLSLQEEGGFWGQKPTKNGSHWAPDHSDAQALISPPFPELAAVPGESVSHLWDPHGVLKPPGLGTGPPLG